MHDDPLHLKAVGEGEGLEPPPGPMVAAEGLGLCRALRLQRGHRLLHLLRARAVGHQDRIGHGDHKQVAQADPTSSSPSASERSSESVQSMAVTGPSTASPPASGPDSRQTEAQSPRSDHASEKGTT